MWLFVLSVLRNNWKILATIGGGAFLCLFCYNKGAQSVQREWDKKIAEETAAAREIEFKNSVLSNELGIGHEKKLNAIDIAYNDAIHSLWTKTSGSMPTTTTTASKSNEQASSDRVHKANKRIGIAREAERNTAKLIDLQQWVKEFCK